MKRNTIVLLVALPVVAVVALAVWSSGSNTGGEALPTHGSWQSSLTRTSLPRRRDFSVTCRWFGKVESRDKVRIIALEPGRIDSLATGDGLSVKQGTLLFLLGGPLISSRQAELEDRLSGLGKQVQLAEQVVAIKRDAVARQFVTREEFAAAAADLARLQAEKQSVAQEKRRVRETAHLRSPVDGVFTNRQVSTGQDIRKGDYLADVISPAHLYIVATLFPSGRDDLQGKSATIDLVAGGPFTGTVTRVMPQRTPAGAVTVWIEGPGLAPALGPGQGVTGTVTLSVHKHVLSVPASAIVRDQQEKTYVMVKTFAGFQPLQIATGRADAGRVEVLAGLKDADEIVTHGAYELFHRDFNRTYKVAD